MIIFLLWMSDILLRRLLWISMICTFGYIMIFNFMKGFNIWTLIFSGITLIMLLIMIRWRKICCFIFTIVWMSIIYLRKLLKLWIFFGLYGLKLRLCILLLSLLNRMLIFLIVINTYSVFVWHNYFLNLIINFCLGIRR